MLVVLPFHSGDKAQAVSLANWIREMAHGQMPVVDDKCLICLGGDTGESDVIEPLRDCFGSVSVFRAEARVQRGEGPMGYMRAANAMWQSVAWKIHFQDKCPWLWLEPDAIPTRPTWLLEIKDEYYRCKKPFSGFKSVTKVAGKPDLAWINGVAVYPASVCDYAPLALQAGETAWDLNSGSQTVQHAHVSSLFQHVYQINGQAPTFPKDKDKLNNAALFHRCKDESLINYLKEVGYTKELSTNSTTRENGTEQSLETRESRAVGLTGGGTAAKTDDSDEIGEPVDYAQRLEEEQRRHPVRPKVPKEGERFGELIWRGGKWHTASDVVEAPKEDRKAVMEKYKRPQKENDLLQSKGRGKQFASISHSGPPEAKEKEPEEPGSPSPYNLSGVTATNVESSGEAITRDVPAQTRHDLIEEAVAVLKQLCTSPHAISKVRKELKKQKVTK